MKTKAKKIELQPLTTDNALEQLLSTAIALLQNYQSKIPPGGTYAPQSQEAPSIIAAENKTSLQGLSSLVFKPKPPRQIKISNPAPRRRASSSAACHVYIAGCPGLRHRALETFYSRFKISLNESGNLQGRIDELNRDAYGAIVRDGDAILFEPGFDAWALQQIVASQTDHASPVQVLTRSIKVELPPGLPVKTFDNRLRARLAPRALYTGDNNIYDLDPSRRPRYTAYSMGTETRLSRVTEIYHYRLRQEGDWLVALIESILTDFAAIESPPIGSLRGLKTMSRSLRDA